ADHGGSCVPPAASLHLRPRGPAALGRAGRPSRGPARRRRRRPRETVLRTQRHARPRPLPPGALAQRRRHRAGPDGHGQGADAPAPGDPAVRRGAAVGARARPDAV
ncbi:MAG: hypothetical protein AVDCRST_MAG85-4033, partial [uncultured Solirubrobacteraceae bacterium]